MDASIFSLNKKRLLKRKTCPVIKKKLANIRVQRKWQKSIFLVDSFRRQVHRDIKGNEGFNELRKEVNVKGKQH